MARVTASSGVPGQGAPAGVGGLIAKLEQQAQRATARLEQKLDEIQERQHKDITLTISKLAIKEQASLKNILSLKTVLSRRLGSTSEELKEQIAESVTASCQLISEGTSSSSAAIGTLNNTLVNEVLQLFDELGASAPELTKGYSKKADDQHTQGLAALNEVLVLMKARLEEISRQHSTFLQNAYDRLNKRVTELAQHSDTELTSAYERLRAETQIYRLDYVGRLDSLSAELLDSISESIALSVLNIQMHSEVRGGNVLLPRLLNYKQLLEGKVQELRDKYKEEVEKSSLERLVELRPMVANQREKLEQAARDARQLRATVEVGQRQEFEKIHDSLVQFIDSKIAEARGLAEFSADELSQIEKSVSVLSDAAGIEADPELAASRAQVLTKLQYIGKQLQGNVNESLRGQIASMEDKGRMLQEELISSMEGNAYAVRKSSETSLAKVKQALEAAYQEISELQNHYLQ